jgi:hypothetical protein
MAAHPKFRFTRRAAMEVPVEEHPSPEKLRRFVAGALPQEEARKVMAHVLQGCQFCSEEASRYNLLRLSRTSQPAPASVSSRM